MADDKADTPTAAQNVPTAFTKRDHKQDEPGEDKNFMLVLVIHFLVVLVLVGLLMKAPDTTAEAAAGAANEVGKYYTFYAHVSIMIVVGFGFLMTFEMRYNYSAVSFNFLLAAFVFVWNQFAAAFWHGAQAGDIQRTSIGMPSMIEGMFGTGAILISFGAVLGKTTPSQLVIIAFWEVIFYSLNFMIGALVLHATDSGGTMFIHTFGAYFGVALAWMLSPKGSGKADHPYNRSSYTSDMFSMIGTTFLWIFWPSFNGALAADGHQLNAIVNTHLSLAGSVIATFLASYLLVHSRIGWDSERRFDMVHIQNATLAGGVAMGAAANMSLAPWVSIVIGCCAGLLSTYGYHATTEALRSKFNIDDTCGVHNLHGMPGILGAIIAPIVILAMDDTEAASIVYEDRTKGEQAGIQLLALVITLAMALVGGVITSKIVEAMTEGVKWPLGAFGDHVLWEVPDDYVSTGQAAQGERGVTPAQAARRHCADAFPGVAPPPQPAADADADAAATDIGAGAGAGAAVGAGDVQLTTVGGDATAKGDATADLGPDFKPEAVVTSPHD